MTYKHKESLLQASTNNFEATKLSSLEINMAFVTYRTFLVGSGLGREAGIGVGGSVGGNTGIGVRVRVADGDRLTLLNWHDVGPVHHTAFTTSLPEVGAVTVPDLDAFRVQPCFENVHEPNDSVFASSTPAFGAETEMLSPAMYVSPSTREEPSLVRMSVNSFAVFSTNVVDIIIFPAEIIFAHLSPDSYPAGGVPEYESLHK